MSASRVAILYHWFEADPRYRDNLVTFLAMTRGLGHPIWLAAASPLPEGIAPGPDLTVVDVPNHGYDFGGHGALLARMGDAIAEFDAFLFVNCSVRGPFLQAGQGRDWTRIFTDRLRGGIELVGATACDLDPTGPLGRHFQARHGTRRRLLHVQSTAYALSKAGLMRLCDADFHEIPARCDKLDIIADYEVRLSDLILSGGGGVSCVMPLMAGVDFRNPDLARFSTSDFGNLIGAEDVLGGQLSPWEVMFTKVSLPGQDQAALLAASYANLRLNTAAEASDWAPLAALAQRWRHQGEQIAARHLAAQRGRISRRVMALRARLMRRWQAWLMGG